MTNSQVPASCASASAAECRSETVSAILDRAALDPQFERARTLLDRTPVNLTGLAGSQKAYLIQALRQASGGRMAVVIVPDILAARALQTELAAFDVPGPNIGETGDIGSAAGGLLTENVPAVHIWRSRDYAWYAMDASGREVEHERLGILRDLTASAAGGVLILVGQGLVQLLPPPEQLAAHTVRLSLSDAPGPERLAEQLATAGYERVLRTEVPGQFARRGDIVDVIPVGQPSERQAGGEWLGYRVSFFDQDIDLMRVFDVRTQRSLDAVQALSVPPAREVLPDAAQRTKLLEQIQTYAAEQVLAMKRERAPGKAIRALTALCERDADLLENGQLFPGLDRWLGLLYSQSERTTILDYLKPLNPLFFADEPARIRQRLDAYTAETIGRIRGGAAGGQTVLCAETAFNASSEPFKTLNGLRPLISLSAISASGNGFAGGETITLTGRDSESFRGRENMLKSTAARRAAMKAATIFAVESHERQDKLCQLFAELGIRPDILPLYLPRGFEYPACGLLVLGTEDVFGTGRRRSRRRKAARQKGIDLFSELEPGDMVVHESYGIGRYDGLITMENDGVRKDYLKIAYAGEDVLYLPMKALDLLQKYIGASGREPRLSRLGGNDWNRLKERARSGIRKLATDLVKLYAERSRIRGYAFPPDTPWAQEFADRFPYEETDDQLRCIAEISADMESDRVMDRLLCGDVGFGKTEVAFRAIFKCVTGGKQAAMIAPTTVLTHQHYENFKARLGDFPIRVGLLSRFTSPDEMRKTVRSLKNGSLDVVIGTHRVLSKDIVFKNLGLLVVDEEQRFGVDHKEQLKVLNPSVDVLTLSATPIPRTLHMSLSGIRDISMLEEPPQDRRSVQTYVMGYDEAVIQAGIERELEREGQVFYLFNDTRFIYDKAEQLQKMLPTARIAVGHGKMHEHQLETVIETFLQGDIDILVCTTIIESGIDMPNVNTIVVERADRMGLAQLYQLKGRVGRSSRQAYAYMTYQRDQVLNETAEKRLTAIRDFTELGAGIRVAMKDLEVRGAGNLLGGEQHGQLDAVGYDLYCKMLSEELEAARSTERQAAVSAGAGDAGFAADTGSAAAVPDDAVRPDAGFAAAGRGMSDIRQPVAPQTAQPMETLYDIQTDAYIPLDYIADDGERIDLYRHISLVRGRMDYHDVLDELTDRYGDPPAAVVTLVDISYIRAQANRCGFGRVALQGSAVRLQYGRQLASDLEHAAMLMQLPDFRGRAIFNASDKQPHILLPGAGESPARVPAILRAMFMGIEQAEADRAKAAQTAVQSGR